MSKKRKLFNEIFNACMCACIFLGASVLIQKLLMQDLEPWVGVIYMLPSTLAYPIGRFLHGRRPRVSLVMGALATAALASIPLVLVFGSELQWFLCMISIPLLTFMLFIIPYVLGSNPLSPNFFIIGVAIFVGVAFVGSRHEAAYTLVTNTVSILFLVVGLFVFNRTGLRSETSPGGGRTKYPAGARRGNTLIVGLFLGIALIAANITAIRDFARELMISVIAAIISFIDWLGSLMGINPGDGSSQSMDSPMDFGDGPAEKNPFFEMLWQMLLWIIIIGIAVALIYAIFKFAKKLGPAIRAFLARLFGSMKSQEEAYVDETEDLSKKGGARRDLAAGIRDVLDKLKRPLKFEDMPNNREKVRFTFKQLLGTMSRRDRKVLSSTPYELENAAERYAKESTRDFIEAYNRARYSDEEIPNEAAEIARKINRKL